MIGMCGSKYYSETSTTRVALLAVAMRVVERTFAIDMMGGAQDRNTPEQPRASNRSKSSTRLVHEIQQELRSVLMSGLMRNANEYKFMAPIVDLILILGFLRV